MYMAPWKENEDVSVVESIVSFEENSQPIARLRCVKDSDGNYEAVIRETSGQGHMLASQGSKSTLSFAKKQCIDMLKAMCKLTEPRYE